MKYKLTKLYTENLNMSSFQELHDSKDEIKLNVNVNMSLLDSDEENIYLLKIDYSIRGINKPIYLNWIGICVLEFDNAPEKKLNPEIFLKNDEIKSFTKNSVDNLSFFVGGKLPQVFELKGKK